MLNTAPKTIEFAVGYKIPEKYKQTLTAVWNGCVYLLSWYEHQENLRKLSEQCGMDWQDTPEANIAGSNGLMIDRRLEVRWRKAESQGKGKGEGKWVAYQPSTIDRRIDKTKSWDPDNIEKVSVFDIETDRRPWINPQWLEPCPLEGTSAIDLRSQFAKKRCEWIAESGVPQVLICDFIGLVVAPAWAAYKSVAGRGRPKYKRPGTLINCIPSESVRGQGKYLGGDRMQLPGLGAIEIPGLERRLMRPLKRMIEAMKAAPQDFKAVDAKIQALRDTARGKLLKAAGISIGALRKQKVAPEEIDRIIKEYDDLVDDSGFAAKAIDYFSMPGSFRLSERDGKTYLQLVAVAFPVSSTPSTREVGVDIGLDFLAVTTTSLVVKHQDFSKQEYRLTNLDRAMSRCVHGSNTWKKLKGKKNKIEGKIKRSRRARQTYVAAQIADTYSTIAVRQVKPLKTVAIPVVRPDGEGGYLPNGRRDSKERNKKIDCATGQFLLKLKQQAAAKGCNITTVDVDESSDANDILEVSKTSPRVVQTRGIAPLTGNGQRVGSIGNDQSSGEPATVQPPGERATDSQSAKTKKQGSQPVPLAGAAKEVKGKRRSKRKERAIG